jgi:hypothetical protein
MLDLSNNPVEDVTDLNPEKTVEASTKLTKI